jgi:hypothetical protein
MNLNPQETIEQIAKLGAELARANAEYVRQNNELAEAEAEYRIAKKKKILQLRADGMSVTLIPDLVKGDEEVAKLMLRRDLAKGLVDAQKYNINSIRDRISIGQSVLNWLKVEYNSGGNQ